MLFYNGLTRRGEGFFPLIVEYALLEHMPLLKYVDRAHLELYPRPAWGNRVLPWERVPNEEERT